MNQIFINLPVHDADASMEFYRQLGFTVNPLFTFEKQRCMAWSDQILVMLQTHEMFQSGNKKTIPDARKNTTASFTLPVESIEKMNEIVEHGLAAGGKESILLIDEVFMQVRTIEDPDGHTWGIICLDVEKFKEMRQQ